MSDELQIKGPDGAYYPLSVWENSHIVGVYEASIPGGKTLRGAGCSCGFRTAPFDASDDGHAARKVADDHKQINDLMEEL